MISNSWFKTINPELQAYRTVGLLQTQRIAFHTIKNGQSSLSWVDFPKAKNLIMVSDCTGGYYVTFKGDKPEDCKVEYHLLPIDEV
jgi:hypothetical protein